MKELVLAALRQIEAVSVQNIWDAHRGCAVIAGAMLSSDGLLPTSPQRAVGRFISQCAADFSINAAPLQDARLPFDIFAQKLLTELAVDAEQPRELGHDVIYCAYVLQALARFDIPPWPSLLERTTSLVRNIKASGPGWITVNGRNELHASPEPDEAAGLDYWSAFANFSRPLAMELGDMQLGHLLTHGHAITIITSHGNAGLAAALGTAFRKRLRVLRLANRQQLDKSPLPQRKVDPREDAYWSAMSEHGNMHGHVLKYAWSFLALRRNHIAPDDLTAFGRIVWPDKPLAWAPTWQTG